MPCSGQGRPWPYTACVEAARGERAAGTDGRWQKTVESHGTPPAAASRPVPGPPGTRRPPEPAGQISGATTSHSHKRQSHFGHRNRQGKRGGATPLQLTGGITIHGLPSSPAHHCHRVSSPLRQRIAKDKLVAYRRASPTLGRFGNYFSGIREIGDLSFDSASALAPDIVVRLIHSLRRCSEFRAGTTSLGDESGRRVWVMRLGNEAG